MRRFLAPPPPTGLEPGAPPTFSVVIAAYQAAQTVGEAVESAMRQTVPPHEVIVVDDGSTDGTRAALDAYRGSITYVRQEHGGAAAAKNAGFRHATGDFVSILDADDVYEPARLEALTELAIARPDLDILMTDLYLDREGDIVGRFSEKTPFADTDQSFEIFERCFFAEPAVRRETLIAVGGFDESLRIGHDWECWIRLLHRGSSAGFVDEPLMRYRIGATSLTADRTASLRERVTVLERASRLDLSPRERRAVARFLPARRRRALLAEAEEALRERRPDSRRRAIRLALAAGVRPTTRIAALVAALAPRTAGRRLEKQRARVAAPGSRGSSPDGDD